MTSSNASSDAGADTKIRGPANRIQISTTKKTLFFYVSLAKRLLEEHETVELSGLGNAISVVASCSEILRNQGAATVKNIRTSIISLPFKENSERSTDKASLQVTVIKGDKFWEVVNKDKEARAE